MYREFNHTGKKIAEYINTTKSYVNRITKKQYGMVNNTFVHIMEALGYDIVLTYVKRDKNNEMEE